MKKCKNLFIFFFLILLSSCERNLPPTEEEQLAIDIEIIDSYLAAKDLEAERHQSGIRYIIDQSGNGDSPGLDNRVIVKYKGSFLGGDDFDSNEIGVNFELRSLIRAWQEMIPEMNEGGKITFYAPSVYCYGPLGSRGIPPNSILVFEVELVSIVKSFDEQLAIDLEIIDSYLETEGILAEIHSSEIRYEILQEGDGLNPNLEDLISVSYNVQYLDGTQVDQDSLSSLRLNDLIDAWRIMVPTMKVGGRLKLYAPSGYCYGDIGTPTIPPNSILVFDIELLGLGVQ